MKKFCPNCKKNINVYITFGCMCCSKCKIVLEFSKNCQNILNGKLDRNKLKKVRKDKKNGAGENNKVSKRRFEKTP